MPAGTEISSESPAGPACRRNACAGMHDMARVFVSVRRGGGQKVRGCSQVGAALHVRYHLSHRWPISTRVYSCVACRQCKQTPPPSPRRPQMLARCARFANISRCLPIVNAGHAAALARIFKVAALLVCAGTATGSKNFLCAPPASHACCALATGWPGQVGRVTRRNLGKTAAALTPLRAAAPRSEEPSWSHRC
eukprot:364612-Chlamydomonas_euryale.AAC.24